MAEQSDSTVNLVYRVCACAFTLKWRGRMERWRKLTESKIRCRVKAGWSDWRWSTVMKKKESMPTCVCSESIDTPKALINNSHSNINRHKTTWKPAEKNVLYSITHYMFVCCGNVHNSGDFIQHKTFIRNQAMKSSSLSDHKWTELTKTALTDSTWLHSRFWQLFTLLQRDGGLNLLTCPKSQFGWSIFFFFMAGGSFAKKDWQWHCLRWASTWTEIVNKHHLPCWQGGCSTLDVYCHSANQLSLCRFFLHPGHSPLDRIERSLQFSFLLPPSAQPQLSSS